MRICTINERDTLDTQRAKTIAHEQKVQHVVLGILFPFWLHGCPSFFDPVHKQPFLKASHNEVRRIFQFDSSLKQVFGPPSEATQEDSTLPTVLLHNHSTEAAPSVPTRSSVTQPVSQLEMASTKSLRLAKTEL